MKHRDPFSFGMKRTPLECLSVRMPSSFIILADSERRVPTIKEEATWTSAARYEHDVSHLMAESRRQIMSRDRC